MNLSKMFNDVGQNLSLLVPIFSEATIATR
jgi:hypothetical protein